MQLVNGHRDRAIRRYVVVGLAVMVMAIAGLSARACDTPVYRYAMYNWAPANYVLFHFVRDAEVSGSDGVDRRIEEAVNAEMAAASGNVNLEFVRLDLESAIAHGELPPALVERLSETPQSVASIHALVAPHGQVLWLGGFDDEALVDVVDSPGRRELTRQLDAGAAGVLIVVEGRSKEENAEANAEVEQAVKMAAEGQIVPVGIPGAEDATTAEPLDVGFVTISRDDPAERWLVSMLMSIESDLAAIEKPMVFAVYGRARAMEPWVGAGIRAEGLAEDIAYMSGACSCEVKDQSRGVDLLTAWDWEKSAMAMAERIGEETGNEQLLSSGELLSAVIIGTGGDIEPEPELAAENTPPDADSAERSSTEQLAETGRVARPQSRWVGATVLMAVLVLAIGTVLMAKRRESGGRLRGETP